MRLTLTTFTDPMMGLSYESEPVFRKLETHYAGHIEFRYAMGLLVRDVHDFMIDTDYGHNEAESIGNYNARLAGIYLSEEPLGGMPINMEGFRLFDPNHRSSLPLNLAYKAACLADPDCADQLLYRLRYATIVETRPTTRFDEILRVVRQTDLDEARFVQLYHSGRAEAALREDLHQMACLGIHSLPAYLLTCGERRMLIRTLAGYDDFVDAIRQLTNGQLVPQAVEKNLPAVSRLMRRHPLISTIELREAFDLATTSQVMRLVQPLIDSGDVAALQSRAQLEPTTSPESYDSVFLTLRKE